MQGLSPKQAETSSHLHTVTPANIRRDVLYVPADATAPERMTWSMMQIMDPVLGNRDALRIYLPHSVNDPLCVLLPDEGNSASPPSCTSEPSPDGTSLPVSLRVSPLLNCWHVASIAQHGVLNRRQGVCRLTPRNECASACNIYLRHVTSSSSSGQLQS